MLGIEWMGHEGWSRFSLDAGLEDTVREVRRADHSKGSCFDEIFGRMILTKRMPRVLAALK